MESIEGYSYYDTPAGPQYVRNDSLDNTGVSFEAQHHINPACNSIAEKYHPYTQRRRPERSSSDQAVHHSMSGRTLHPNSISRNVASPKANSFICPDPTMYETAGSALHFNAEMTGSHAPDESTTKSDPHSKYAINQLHLVTNSPKNMSFLDDSTVRGQKRSASSDGKMDIVESEHLIRSPINLVEPNLEHWPEHSWYIPPHAMLDNTNRQYGHYWPMQGIVESSKCAEESASSSRLSMGGSVLDHLTQSDIYQQPLDPIQPSLSEFPTTNESLDPTMLHGNFMMQHEHDSFQIPVDETLFEYGPFLDFSANSGQVMDTDSSWQTPGHNETSEVDSPAQMETQSALSCDDLDRPQPQVGLVGGYFAPEEETSMPTPPEVNSQGNIRISRLPPKRPPIAYESPAIPDMTVSQLKSELKKYGLQAVGKKTDLQARLKAFLGDGTFAPQWSG